jgi:hypothetical protein
MITNFTIHADQVTNLATTVKKTLSNVEWILYKPYIPRDSCSKYINIKSSFEDLVVTKLTVKTYMNLELRFERLNILKFENRKEAHLATCMHG